ncbi:GNAT family N-acetyltransferase [Nonomuraea rhizosphaerae]|uniref:GNAT family N-acetyltransferase n=1 Tax=Nonomuraea rhizosphaerae TaxID=2665663 RepID=UPI001C5EDF49|nr:GNAT family N-acetyltransferase [Nonomuraea rhizosphaerae]
MWTFTADVEEYAAAAEAFLLTDPVGNTVPLTVLANVRGGMPADEAFFGWWTGADGEVRGAAFRTPPHPVGLARMAVETIAPLAEVLKGDLPEVQGPLELTDALAEHLGPPERVMAERLYRLGDLSLPEVSGRGRLAGPADFPLLVSWFLAFGDEVGLGLGRDPSEQVEHRLAGRQLFLWEDDGAPVSLAALSPAAGGVCRIGPVYTPPACRRRGYGAAVTAHASRVALEERCEQVVLFTDLANPTSNKVYQSIGYVPVSDYAQVTYRG